MKASKIASIAYYVLLVLSVAVFVLFFCVGFGNMESLPSGYYKSPQFTDLLMYWKKEERKERMKGKMKAQTFPGKSDQCPQILKSHIYSQ